MNSGCWPRVVELFRQAAELVPAHRAAFLQNACAGDEELWREVESLLAHDASQDEVPGPAVERGIERLPGDSGGGGDLTGATTLTDPGLGSTPWLPAVIGRYRVLRLVGEGGMGAVYEAEQEHPRRFVALKIIKPGRASRELLRRFEQESQALGRLQHPGIAQIYDAGTADTGFGPQPYFAMEFIRGQSLRDYAQAHGLNTRQRLELVARIAEAVHHAHQRGIIHRDLKPGNILVDETGQPKILDFGVARVTDSDAQATRQTDMGQLVGTLAYMSPEQVLADPLELDTRSDVYALGVILYELLAGRMPYTLSRNLHEAVQTIREEDPSRLSSINRNYRGDIETMVARALEKDKARRYASAAGLAADIRHYLADEPITARPASTSYQLQKFARRHRALVGGAAAVFVVLIAGIVISTWEARRARLAEQVALRESATAKAVNDFLENDLLAQASANTQARPDTRPDPDLKVRTALDRAAVRIEGKFKDQPLVEASIRQTMGDTYRDLGLYADAQRQMERALDVRQRVLGQEHRDTLTTMNLLAQLYFEYQGKDAQAEPLFLKILKVRRGALGEDNPDTLTSLSDLAVLYRNQGKYGQAEPLLVGVLKARRRILGEEDPLTLTSMNDLAGLYDRQGKYDQAEPLYTKLLEVRRRVLGGEHPDTLTGMNNLALLYLHEGKCERAEPLFKKALEAWRRVLGEEHPYVLTGMNNLALLYGYQRKYKQSEAIFTKVLEARRRVRGKDDLSTLTSMNNLAMLYREEGKYHQAEPLFATVVETGRRVLSDAHPLTLTFMNNLALAYLNQHKYKEAEALLHEASNGHQKAMTNSWVRYDCLSMLGASLAGQKGYAEAEPLLVSGYEGMLQREASIPAPSRFKLEQAGKWIVQLYQDWGKPEQVANWARKLQETKLSVPSKK